MPEPIQQVGPQAQILIEINSDGQLQIKVGPAELPAPTVLGLIELAKAALIAKATGGGQQPHSIMLANRMPPMPNGHRR